MIPRRGYHAKVTIRVPTAGLDPADRAPAPGSLGLVQAFINTVSLKEGSQDLLLDRPQTVGWLRAAGVLSPDPVVISSSEHTALLRLREALRAVLIARTEGKHDEEAAAHLTKALADGRLVLTVNAAAGAHWATAARSPYPSVVAAIAIAIAESVTTGTWPYLRACAAQDCGWAFYEKSGATRCSAH
jgi:predicted RNA-binding Zn ribbon-like protein